MTLKADGAMINKVKPSNYGALFSDRERMTLLQLTALRSGCHLPSGLAVSGGRLGRRRAHRDLCNLLANNNALQFAAGSGYRVDPIPCRGTADEAPA
jgi:hypothetical protein